MNALSHFACATQNGIFILEKKKTSFRGVRKREIIRAVLKTRTRV